MRGEKEGKESMWSLLKKSFVFDTSKWFYLDDSKHILINNQIVKTWNLKFNDEEREKISWWVRTKKIKKVLFLTQIILTR
jgi:hypothetical protein